MMENTKTQQTLAAALTGGRTLVFVVSVFSENDRPRTVCARLYFTPMEPWTLTLPEAVF